MKKKSFIVVVIWIIIILSILIYNELILSQGKEFLMKAYPYDPRDFLRGDYVELVYEIEGFSGYVNDFPDVPHYIIDDIKCGDNLYILLCENNDKYAKYCGLHFSKPEHPYFIKAEVASDGKIIYPQIQRYYLKEGKGKILEHKLLKGGVAKVRINKRGDARIKEIIAD